MTITHSFEIIHSYNYMKPILKTCGIHSTINRRVQLILVATGLPLGPGHQGHPCRAPQFVYPSEEGYPSEVGEQAGYGTGDQWKKGREAGNEVEYTLRRVVYDTCHASLFDEDKAVTLLLCPCLT